MLIDAHCHFFTNSIMTDSVTRLENTVTRLERIAQAAKSKNRQLNDIEVMGANSMAFLNTAIENTPLEMYNIMKDKYGCDFIAVPLMLDLSYTFLAPKSQVYDKRKSLANSIKKVSEKSRSDIKLEQWHIWTKGLEETLDKYDRSVLASEIFTESYEDQIDDLLQLKEELPDRVFPFFSIDPRRNDSIEGGVLSEIKKYVGKDKPFTGLKLYTSLGYSPTHPVLYDNDGFESVYGYCEENGIPITIHASLEGFSHMLDENHVEGDIYYPEAGYPVPSIDLFEDGIVKYQKKFASLYFQEVISERLLRLNHPLLWRKVLEKYPRLKLNMAHLGGSIQLIDYSKGSAKGFWTKYILEIMRDFPNVYTDLSCFYDGDETVEHLERIYKDLYLPLSEDVKKRVMYGSDYFMITLFDADLADYINAFRTAFGTDFKDISELNPRLFLGLD